MSISTFFTNVYDFTVRHRHSVIAVLAAVLFSFVTNLGAPVSANDKRVVSISFDGYKKTISTEAGSVEEVLKEAGIDTIDADLVEPSIDTEIISDVFNINIYRARPVTVIDGAEQYNVLSAYQSPQRIAEQAGITVYKEDKFDISRINDFLGVGAFGEQLVITRSTPVKVNLYGTQVSHRTHSTDWKIILEEMGIDVAEKDIVQPRLDATTDETTSLSLIRVGREVISTQETIPFQTRTIYDSNLMTGTNKVRTAGVVGKRLTTYQVEYHNDKEVSRKVLQQVVASEPKQKVIVVGTRVPDPSSNVAIGKRLAAARGWTGAQWGCTYELFTRESNWNHLAVNPSSGAYGIPQSLPGNKMADVAPDWRTNPETQLTWGMIYIKSRYGTPCAAIDFHNANNWY